MKKAVLAVAGSLLVLISTYSQAGTMPKAARTMTVEVMVPADVHRYNEMITGIQDFRAAAELPFVKKKVVVPYSRDRVRASADAAAREMPGQNGPFIVYLKVKKGTAYVLLYSDGYAGVSFSWARCRPVVEKTLLQFETIKRVVWDQAPGEKRLYDRDGRVVSSPERN